MANDHHVIDDATVTALYTRDHLTCQEIGDRFGVTRQAIAARLRRLQVSTRRGEWAETTCAYCGSQFSIRRKRWRTRRRHYCTAEHYYASRENSDYVLWRQGSNLARAVVAQHFPLAREHVVHHLDHDQRNNDRANLVVYASQSEHLKAHHGRPAALLWDGRVASGQPSEPAS